MELRKKLPELKEVGQMSDWFVVALQGHPSLSKEVEQLYEDVRSPLEVTIPTKLNQLEELLQNSLASSKHLMSNAEEVDRYG